MFWSNLMHWISLQNQDCSILNWIDFWIAIFDFMSSPSYAVEKIEYYRRDHQLSIQIFDECSIQVILHFASAPASALYSSVRSLSLFFTCQISSNECVSTNYSNGVPCVCVCLKIEKKSNQIHFNPSSKRKTQT